MTATSEPLAILIAGIVSFLLGVAGGILIALHSYALGLLALVLSLAGWGWTLKLSTRS
jgi:hypothetical protein